MRFERRGSAGDDPSDGVRHDRERAAKIDRMQALVDEARASGISPNSAEKIRAAARKQAPSDA